MNKLKGIKEFLFLLYASSKSYLKAKFGPKTQLEEYVERLSKCLSCSWNIEKGCRNYCKGCGCPQTKIWPDSNLKVKAYYKNATCPRKRWK